MRLNARLAPGDQVAVPDRQVAQDYEATGRYDGLEANERTPGQKTELLFVFSFVAKQVLPENLEPKGHEEDASKHGEDHVEEEVPVVPVPNAAVDPWAVVVHLQDAAIAH